MRIKARGCTLANVSGSFVRARGRLTLVVAVGCLLAMSQGCTMLPSQDPRLTAISYQALPGWPEQVAPQRALQALRRSCRAHVPRALQVYHYRIPGRVWARLCRRAALVPAHHARLFFEDWFQPYRVQRDTQTTGLLTAYYTPTLEGSLRRSAVYPVPVYGLPTDPRRRQLSRAQIDAGALAGEGLEVMWLKDAVDAFFLHVQGSGYVTLPDGEIVKLIYAGRNAHPYTAIGRHFIEQGMVAPDAMSMQWLKDWLRRHPEQAEAVMQRNASYIYFTRARGDEGIEGAEGATLTPRHSLAVDTDFISYGVPCYFHSSDRPEYADASADSEEQALFGFGVAQDRGSAITGPMRADLYMGIGEEAGARAGTLRARVGWYVLLPRQQVTVAPP